MNDKHTPGNNRPVTGCSERLLYDLHPSPSTVPSEGSQNIKPTHLCLRIEAETIAFIEPNTETSTSQDRL